MTTFSAKPSDVVRSWYLVDAAELPLGRLSTQIATYLTGKRKPMFTQHIDCGDYVVVINADKLVVTGNKLKDKMYYHHSGFPGGLRERTLADQMAVDATEVIRLAVRGMIPANKLRDDRLQRLKIYPGTEHRHEAQQPKKVSMK
jgi:large subunit ribosomal protein L13